MKVLVTGATGFLGKYVVEELHEHGYEVIAVGRNEVAGEALVREGVHFVKADFTRYEELEAAFLATGVTPDFVVHAGALSTVWGRWQDFYASNVKATEYVLRLCHKYGVKRLVYISSPSIYACGKDQVDLKEYTPEKNELNYYIRSKLMAERRVKHYREKCGKDKSAVETVVLRPRGLIGIGDTSVIPRVLRISQKVGVPLIHGGKQLVDLTCVENVALAIRLALESPLAAGQTYNITNGEPRAFKAILDEFLKEMGIRPRYLKVNAVLLKGLAVFLEKSYRLLKIYQEPMFTLYSYYLLRYSQTLNIDKAREELGYSPKISLSEGIAKYARHAGDSKKMGVDHTK